MADRVRTFDEFCNSFGVPAYDRGSVPDGAAFPRITYQYAFDTFNRPVAIELSAWDRSTSWQGVNELADAIENKITRGGIIIGYDGGAVWITPGSPFRQRMNDEDDMIRRISFNLFLEFIE